MITPPPWTCPDTENLFQSVRDRDRSPPPPLECACADTGFLGGDRKPPLRLSAIIFACWFAQGPATIWIRSWNYCTNPPPPFWMYETPLLNPGSAPDVDDVTQAMSRGGGVLANVQEWGCFSIFRRADDVTRPMSIYRRADDVTQTMSKMSKGCLWNVFTPPPPSGNPVSAPVICVKFRANRPLCPPLTKAFPYAYAIRPNTCIVVTIIGHIGL